MWPKQDYTGDSTKEIHMTKQLFTKYSLVAAIALLCCGVAKAGDKIETAGKATAVEKPVAQEILDILRANNQITTQQYDALMVKVNAEVSKSAGEGKRTPGTLRVFWKDGLNFEGGDDAPVKFQTGGYFQADWAYTSPDTKLAAKLGKSSTGTQMRRARLSVAGSLYDTAEYKFESDLAAGAVKIMDAYVQLNSLPWVGTMRMGHFKEPFALSEVTSDRYETFM